MSVNLTIIILTKNESIHLGKYLPIALGLTENVILVDSFSDDDTLDIARSLNVKVYQHAFINHAEQLNWALDHCNITTGWVMKLDADEYLTPELISEIRQKLDGLSDSITGLILKRRVYFMGQWIRHGGYYPIKLIRIWRKDAGRSENRWMDEHIVLSHGNTIELEHDFIDENLNNLTWWTDKHNHYSTREAFDLLNTKYGFQKNQSKEYSLANKQNQQKRWLKQNFYGRLPLFLRAWLYFNYRYIFQLGFLDGRKGLVWHFLQGFWYRFLVDSKILQIEWLAKKEKKSVKQILEENYGLK
ncbi:MAG: glycosyltransferase family 2 protein [Saprospiraceae bacterium]|uniref:Glycosyltransferase family 2 protein n=1 Tax=Candidatus Opimibacter skivensis TaxID=2982028 RepID=A0A9D7SUL2_9BACT|nr:glycosyltransferase family 2 protein [Candidatus Opimibacter skivensis]